MGFREEGVQRWHMVSKGRSRDTSWWAICGDEWEDKENEVEIEDGEGGDEEDEEASIPPSLGCVRAAFERWLDPSNFDEQGKQKKRLEDIRAEMQNRKSVRMSSASIVRTIRAWKGRIAKEQQQGTG